MTETIENSVQIHRIRLTYARGEALRYVSHLDMQLVWERTLRRARMPLAFTKGFNPNPRLHLASALPLGFLSRCEIADFWLETPAEEPAPVPAEVAEKVQAAAPPGLIVLSAGEAALNEPALQTQVQSAEYIATPLVAMRREELEEAAARLLTQESIIREKRGKQRGKMYDLRPLIECVDVQPGENSDHLFLRLAAREGATGRPEETIAAMGYEPNDFRVERMKLILG